jgi:hypothetical protein
VTVLVGAILLQNPVANPDALLELVGLLVVRSEPDQHVDVGVGEALALDHGPILVEVLHQVLASVEFGGLLVFGGGFLRPPVILEVAAFMVAKVELLDVRHHPDGRAQTIVVFLEHDDVFEALRTAA